MKQVELNEKKNSGSSSWSWLVPATCYDLEQTENRITAKLDKILMNQAELAEQLRALQAQGVKIAKEQQDRADALNKSIADLQAIIAAGGPVTQEVTDALANVQSTFKSLDDTIPDPVAAS